MPERYKQQARFCAWCGESLKDYLKHKGVYCSDSCKHEHKIRTSRSYARKKVFERDGGVCSMCELDTVGLIQRLNGLSPEEFESQCEALGIPKHRKTLWDMDHILPVKDGGGACGLDNLRTLCIWCHKDVV